MTRRDRWACGAGRLGLTRPSSDVDGGSWTLGSSPREKEERVSITSSQSPRHSRAGGNPVRRVNGGKEVLCGQDCPRWIPVFTGMTMRVGCALGPRTLALTSASELFLPGLDPGIHSVWRYRMDPRVKPEGEGRGGCVREKEGQSRKKKRISVLCAVLPALVRRAVMPLGMASGGCGTARPSDFYCFGCTSSTS